MRLAHKRYSHALHQRYAFYDTQLKKKSVIDQSDIADRNKSQQQPISSQFEMM